MYRALYDFKDSDAHALNFSANDQFTVLDSSNDYWWLVQNGFGEVGYVPCNYLSKDNVAYSEVLRSIDRAIETIHFAASSAGGNYTHQQRDNLQKLVKHREVMAKESKVQRSNSVPKQPKRQAPGPPDRQAGVARSRHTVHGDPSLAATSNKTEPKPDRASRPTSVHHSVAEPRQPPGVQDHHQHGASHRSKSSSVQEQSQHNARETVCSRCQSRDAQKVETEKPLQIPEGLWRDTVEQMRRHTKLSHDMSQVAIRVVLQQLHDHVESLRPAMEDLIASMDKLQTPGASGPVFEGSHDAVRLNVILAEMEACKDDSQQRSWALHEDEAVITEYLQELISILSNADQELCKSILAKDHFSAVHNLVLYYQMETRLSIRLILLKVFGLLCGLDARNITELLTSVLPVELARDMQACLDEIERVTFSSLVLTMILSQGEAVPVQHYGILNKDFILFLLDKIDAPPPEDADEQLPELFVNLILAYNLHFELPAESIVMKALQEKATAKGFTEKVMLLVNRGDDPVRMFPHEPRPVDSVLKLLSDLYSQPSTSNLLYTNDANVLIDIIIRQLRDLSPGDSVRTEHLSLLHLITRNSSYSEKMYRRRDLTQCFNKIMSEEEEESKPDKMIVQQIWQELPDCFV